MPPVGLRRAGRRSWHGTGGPGLVARHYLESAFRARRRGVGIRSLMVIARPTPIRQECRASRGGCQACTCRCKYLYLDASRASTGRCPPFPSGHPLLYASPSTRCLTGPSLTADSKHGCQTFRSAFHLPPACFTRSRMVTRSRAMRTPTSPPGRSALATGPSPARRPGSPWCSGSFFAADRSDAAHRRGRRRTG
jgi:hypothetical protein